MKHHQKQQEGGQARKKESFGGSIEDCAVQLAALIQALALLQRASELVEFNLYRNLRAGTRKMHHLSLGTGNLALSCLLTFLIC